MAYHIKVIKIELYINIVDVQPVTNWKPKQLPEK